MIGQIPRVVEGLRQRAQSFCAHYLHRGIQEGKYWRVGDAHNNPGRSLAVTLAGPYRGRWRDWAHADSKGDLLQILRIQTGSLTNAMYSAQQFINTTPLEKEHTMQATNDLGLAFAEYYWIHACAVTPGSCADDYLNARGISYRPPQDVLRCLYMFDKSWLITPIIHYTQHPNGKSGSKLIGVMRTALFPTTRKREIIGTARQGAVVFGSPCRGDADTLVIAEGIETGLSYVQLYPGKRVMVTYGVQGAQDIPISDEINKLIVASDNDDAGDRMYEKILRSNTGRTVTRHKPKGSQFKGEPTSVQTYLGQDFNDELRNSPPAH